MRKRTAALLFAAAMLGLAAQAAALPHATPKNYKFSFSVASKASRYPSGNFPKVTGGGAGSFSIAHRQVDADGTYFWDVTSPRGSITLSSGGRSLAKATIVGGHFSVEATGRSVLFRLRLASSRFHCAKPDATLGLDYLPLTKGNQEGMSFDVCSTHLRWTGTPPKLAVSVKPA